MYRAYEKPQSLEDRLLRLKSREDTLRQMLRNTQSRNTMDELYDDLVKVQLEIEELEERINHVWQDEYEEDGIW